MKNEKFKTGNSTRRLWAFFLIFILAFLMTAPAAEEFGDIAVSAGSMYSGNTYHGYGETRVTLVYPNNTWNNGNSISRLTRTVKLEPGAQEIVSLLQPPLPANGDNNIRVEVDGRREGDVRAPNANNHCNFYGRSGGQATLLISRSLDFDAIGHLFNAGRGAFTAAMATGAPDCGGGGGYKANSWMPDTRRYNTTNWLELDYDTPQVVERVTVHYAFSASTVGSLVLRGASGTNLVQLPFTAGRNSYSGSTWQAEFTLPTTSEPVKTVRLNFGKQPPHSIGIDAVEIWASTNSQWAAEARASSDNSASAASYAPGSTSANNVESVRAETPVNSWSESWLAYTPFDAVALNASDLAGMPAAVVNALGDYLYAGGNIFIAGKSELPADWHATETRNMSEGAEHTIGLGHCFIFPTENMNTLEPKTLQVLRDRVRESGRYWQMLPSDSTAANNAMPVVKNLQVPIRGIVVIMVAFIIVIGPVNIIVLNRRQKRTWMLWTIPAISFATTLIVFAYSLLREGITPDTRIAGFTILDQTSHHAATIGASGFYCPLTPSSGLHFEAGTEAAPLVTTSYGSGGGREVDWTQGQHFSHGWVSARVPAHFHLRKSETRRERIQIINENGTLQIFNSLGTPIKAIWYADTKLNLYEANNVAAGQKAGLVPSQKVRLEQSGPGAMFREIGYTANADTVNEKTARHLTPNTYIAVLDGNPFVENALGAAASATRTKASAAIFGLLETPETK